MNLCNLDIGWLSTNVVNEMLNSHDLQICQVGMNIENFYSNDSFLY